MLSDYFHHLRTWKRQYAPQQPEDEWHPLFVEALQRESHIEYLLDVLLDGNTVKSSDLFSGNAVTVVNFWFTTCGPCVGELGDLDALNKDLSGKGGALIGINAFTLDGNEAAISDAKDVLTQSGATYQNVYFDSGSEAGKFVENIYAYPTTYVVNRSGRIVGDPIVGAITSKAQADALQAQIDKALAADMG